VRDVTVTTSQPVYNNGNYYHIGYMFDSGPTGVSACRYYTPSGLDSGWM
jgi:hypothetical protein